GAVVFNGEYGERSDEIHCPKVEVMPRGALIGALPEAPVVYAEDCDGTTRPGMREVFLGVDDHTIPSSGYFSFEDELPSLNERRQMVVQAIGLLEATSNAEFLQRARQALADGYPHVLHCAVNHARRRLQHAEEKDQDALAVLLLDLYEAKAISDTACATDLKRNFDVTHHRDKPRYTGIREATQRRAEAMYAALPDEAINPPARERPPMSKARFEATKEVREARRKERAERERIERERKERYEAERYRRIYRGKPPPQK
ncbi:MAG: hypothetical protein AAGJ56_09000, partial [Myxococcota bacterium]